LLRQGRPSPVALVQEEMYPARANSMKTES
jgi:hypothetical protein